MGAGLGGGAEEGLSVGSRRRGYTRRAAQLEGEWEESLTLRVAAEGMGTTAEDEDPSP